MKMELLKRSKGILRDLYHWPAYEKINLEYKKYCRCMLPANYYDRCLRYVEERHISGFEYGFSESSNINTIYSSTYACLLKGLYGGYTDVEKNEWIDYFNSCQRTDGLFHEPNYQQERYYYGGEGWGATHLVPHLTIAYERLNSNPRYEFSYLNDLKDPDKMIQWLSTLDYKKIWGSSNEIMNRGVAMQYARDKMGMPFDSAIQAMEDYLLKNIRKEYGMWYEGSANSIEEKNEMVRGAYHILPILYYDHITMPYADQAIEVILKTQNRWGGFDQHIGSSACEDIDGLDPLIRLAVQQKQTKDERIVDAVKKAKRWILFNQNIDGGFVFSRGKPFMYGGQKVLTSLPDESNLFATWFRAVSLELINDFETKQNNRFDWTPGYECPIL